MRRTLLGLFLLLLAPAGLARAQSRVVTGDYGGWSLLPGQAPASLELPDPPPPPPPTRLGDERVWVRSDMLLWTVRNGGPHFPLVTTDSVPGTATAGSLASPTVASLYGNNGFDYHLLLGTRLSLGGWFDPGQRLGMEASGFLFAQRAVGFAARSNAAGQPALYVPGFNAATQREDSVVVADPVLRFSGNVALTSSLRLWGTELNLLHRILKSERWQVDVLGGFRYLDLGESFDLQNTTTDLTTGTITSLADRFQTRNQFYGAQAGVRAQSNWGANFFGTASFQVAMGATQQTVAVTGSAVTAAGAIVPGGLFAEPSNIGRQTHATFTVIPQLGGTVGCRLTTTLSLIVGYDALFWANTVRPGNQIDRVVNLSQNAALGAPGGALVGPARPGPAFNRSDFTAQGVSLGLMWQY